ncbi:hypothetical protein SADUNF_Sadunf14G0133300 [Salix dunnii]|uniref:Large ribosomal subunit protein uL18 C-terminal eukaryotes domain-containing protein n=1 Tax=Salix dunnii TaxID=1413687 RepID=A0A835JG92_9ROSI|nr:hypothetical protein SADUNF_Sadunf14G0133300 [Salix dunnii]
MEGSGGFSYLHASIAGDFVVAAAYSHELPRYGLEVGLSNYAAAYCTGLLLARRVLKTLEMDEDYEGNVEAIGEDYFVELADSRRPFCALLDVGLVRTTTGNRVFSALKVVNILFNKDGKQLDAEVHHKYIYGGHIAAYLRVRFVFICEYIKRGIEPDNMEELYKKVHVAIRANPTAKKSEKQLLKEHKRYNLKKLTCEERRAKLVGRLKALNSAAADDEE